MSNIVAFSGANLPAVSTLSTALRSIAADVGPAGVVILKMDKTGHWVYGADQTEIEDDSTWAINPFSFIHGLDRKSTRLNSSHIPLSRMPSSA